MTQLNVSLVLPLRTMMMDPSDTVDAQISQLEDQIHRVESQLAQLRGQLQQIKATRQQRVIDPFSSHDHGDGRQALLSTADNTDHTVPSTESTQPPWPLSSQDYRRYGRQLIMPEVGLKGQLRLKAARVLIVGVGGLGCPAALYLAGAGVGTLGLVDGDTVEESNLHRQIAHTTSLVGVLKVDSAIAHLRDLNPTVTYVPHRQHLQPSTALDIVSRYNLVLDCTDHPTSRYLISDAAVCAGIPLVSASALRTEGQLIVLNDPPFSPGAPNGGPCYRCIWPVPPPPDALTSCGDGGILGPVVGVMGVLQALEAIKILTRAPLSTTPLSSCASTDPPRPSLLLFSAFAATHPFRCVRMRGRRSDCAACSARASVTPQSLIDGSTDYVAFCGGAGPGASAVLAPELRIDARTLAERVRVPAPMTIVDVRPAVEYDLCRLPGSVNVPWSELPSAIRDDGNDKPDWLAKDGRDLIFVCRRGNDSQLAVKLLQDRGLVEDKRAVDVRGGFIAWRRDVDPSWPDY